MVNKLLTLASSHRGFEINRGHANLNFLSYTYAVVMQLLCSQKKSGWGVQPESKSFGIDLLGLLIDIRGERGDLDLSQKFWGSFGVSFR